MTIIRMETEKVHALAKKLDTDGSQMLSILSQMRSSASRLYSAWQGGSADEFHNDLDSLLRKIEDQVVVLQTLSTRVSREVDEWITIDGSGAAATGRAREAVQQLGKQQEELQKLWPDPGILGPSGNAASILGGLLGIGRSNPVGALFDAPGAILSALHDKDPNKARAFFTNFASTYGPYALLLIPPPWGEVAFAVYQAPMMQNSYIQLYAAGQVYGDKLFADTFVSDPNLYRQLARNTTEFYENAERFDLQRLPKNIAKSIYDYQFLPAQNAIGEVYRDPSITNILQLGITTLGAIPGSPVAAPFTTAGLAMDAEARKDLWDDVRAVGVDTANLNLARAQAPITLMEHGAAYGAAGISVAANHLPMPASWKGRITQAATTFVDKVNDIPEIYDVVGLEKPRDYTE